LDELSICFQVAWDKNAGGVTDWPRVLEQSREDNNHHAIYGVIIYKGYVLFEYETAHPTLGYADYALQTTKKVQNNNFTHVCVTYGSTTGARIYLDAKLNVSDTASRGQFWPIAHEASMGIGNVGGDRNRPFPGRLDEVYLFPFEMTAAEVEDLHDLGIKPSGGRPLFELDDT
jgi:hypothetical protein